MSLARSFFLSVWLVCVVFSAQAQVYEGKTLVTASLVADTTAIVPGQPFQVGLLLDQAPTWHTYWQYPGDAGIPTTIEWTLPEGFTASPIQWPLPHHTIEPGDLEVFAYDGKVLLIVTITPPAKIAESTVSLKASAQWLVCAEICVPGNANLDLALPVAATAQPANAEIFDSFRQQLPRSEPAPYGLKWSSEGKTISLTVDGVAGAKSVELFPLPAEGQEVGHPKSTPAADGAVLITISATGSLKGVLIVENEQGRRGWFVSSENAAASPSLAPQTQGGFVKLISALAFGFLGGLILNLMPCVLPVISLKIFGFIRQAGSDPKKILAHGFAFSAGIFAWFLGLGLLIVALKSAGSQVTWAFQFQNPWFNLVIGCIVFVFALNLFGVFEIILPGRAARTLDDASGGEGYGGSFFQGVFATLLATPCTAPFLGSALGYAFSQPAPVILAMFASVALGMSAPYLLLSAQPGWMKILPKPGAWMERVKQFMGFPLMATLIWLFFVLGNQKGAEAVVWAMWFLLCLALACWIYGAFCGPLSSGKSRTVSLLLIAAIIGLGGWYFLGNKFSQAQLSSASQPETGGIAWQPFSQKALDGLLAEGKPVFVDFTADWCISCKYNEKTAIDTPAVREALEKGGFVPVKADWTNANPEITAALQKFGRVGVPFYLVYPAGKPDAPLILPEILTQGIVLEALAKAAK